MNAYLVPKKSVAKLIGIDNFALNTGQSDGTINIDLKEGQSMFFLEDVHANTLATWANTSQQSNHHLGSTCGIS
jgi:hypothetical protein